MELKFQTTPKSDNLFHKFYKEQLRRERRWAAMNTVDNLKHPTMKRWSWKDIQAVYAAFGQVLETYKGYQTRCNIPRQMNINLSDDENLFILRFWRDVQRVDSQLAVLDAEIARRNSLIGVMG